MRIKYILDEDFVNYKKPSMFIATIFCDGKCFRDLKMDSSICQNNHLRNNVVINMEDSRICERYLHNSLTNAIVFGGLEPFEQTEEVVRFIDILRNTYLCNDDIVIYTGYTPLEIVDKVRQLKGFGNIIIKYGRFIPNSKTRFDDILGVTLSSENQFAERI